MAKSIHGEWGWIEPELVILVYESTTIEIPRWRPCLYARARRATEDAVLCVDSVCIFLLEFTVVFLFSRTSFEAISVRLNMLL